MKHLLSRTKLFSFVLILALTQSATIAQNAANYTFSTDTSSSLAKDRNGNAIDMSTGTTLLLDQGIDATASPVNTMDFTYFLMGKPFTQFAVQDDGIMQLGGLAPFTNGFSINSGTPTAPLISAFSGDLRTGLATGKIHYKKLGVAPNRVLVIEFKNMQLFYTTADVGTSTYQIRLYENGSLEFVYGAMSVTSIGSSNRNPSVGFFTGAAAGLFASVSYATHTVATTGVYTPNLLVPTTGPIPELTTSTDSTRRSYFFTPPPAPAAPTNLIFTNTTAFSTIVKWTDNDSNEAGYQIFRSIDNGITYASISSLSANTTTYLSTDLMPNKQYFWRVIAIGEGGVSDTLAGNHFTQSAALVKSTNTGGRWTNPLTWIGGVVPAKTDSVVIADSAIVTINSDTATCYALTVGEGAGGLLRFDSATSAILTVINNVSVLANATFNAGPGSLTTHNLKIGGTTATALVEGSLRVYGTFDMQTTAGVTVAFAGIANAKIEGTPTVLDFRNITVNKGASSTNRPILEILCPFTVQGANTIGLISTHTAGLVRIGGIFTQSNPLYVTTNYTIPLNGGVHLNNPNFSVTGLNGSSTCNGLLQVSQGVYTIGQTAAHVFTLSGGSTLTVDGGSLVAAGAINAGTNTITFNFSSGTINVAKVGNSSSNIGSFHIAGSTAKINWTGGVLTLEQKSTGATQIDYVTSPFIGNAGAILQIGNTSTAANATFNIRGTIPNLVVDTLKTAALTSSLVNVLGTINIKPGSVLKLNGFTLQHSGSTVTNNGFIDGRTTNSNWMFSPSVSGHTHAGTGIDTLFRLIVADTNAVVLNKPVIAYGISFNSRSPLTNSKNLTLGNGLAQIVTVQLGITGYTNGNVGIFDSVPTFNLGTGAYNVSYLQEGAIRTTGIEIPPTRSLGILLLNNSNNVILAGGPVDISTMLSLGAGRLITTSTNLPRITGTVSGAIAGGSATTYVDGPLQRRLPASLKTASTYIFPVGKDAEYNRVDFVNTGTNAGGTVDLLVESFNTWPTGTADHITIDTLQPKYWKIEIPTGKANIDSTYAKFYNANLTVLNKMAYSDSASGSFKRVSNAGSAGTITTTKLVGDTSIDGAFAIGEITNAISGTFLIGAGKTAPNYKTLTEAINNMADRKVVGNIVLLLDADYSSALETFPISLNPFITASPDYTITVKPNAGVTATITGNNATLIRFTNGTKNYVFDGSNNGTQSQNLFIHNTNPTTSVPVAVVMFQGTVDNQGVQNCIIKNTIIKGRLGTGALAYGILFGGTAVNLSAGGMGHKNVLIQNNTIYNCDYAIALNGVSATSKVAKITLSRNTIGSDSSSLSNRRCGIFTRYADSITVEYNTIKNIVSPFDDARIGISINDYTTNSLIYGNTIKGLYTNQSFDFADGILIVNNNGVDNIRIVNNTISNISSSATSSAATIFKTSGIRLLGGNNLKLYFNTVHLSGMLNTGTGVNSSAALYLQHTSLVGLDIRNNIFSNSMTGLSATSKHYAFASIAPFASSIFDYNDFITNSAQGVLMYQSSPILYLNTMAELRTATTANTNSVNINPQFINDTTFMVGDGPLTGLGQQIAGYTMDINDTVRTNPPTMGAYQRKGDIAPPLIGYTVLTKQALPATGRTLTDFATITDNRFVDTAAAKPRVYYRKTSEANVFGTAANNNASFNGWKYVEANNTVSPFSFNLDYSLLTSGSVSAWDTILYFVTAQDTINNTSASPFAGFLAKRVDSILSAPTTPNRYVIYDTVLAGTYLVGKTHVYPNFNSIQSAVNALHIRGVNGPVVLRLTDSLYTSPAVTFPITINEIEGASTTNTITLRPDTALTVSIIGSSPSGLINFNGTDNFIIDGSNNGTNSQNLFIQNTATTGVGIMYQGTVANKGSENSMLKNTIIKGSGSLTSYGVIAGGSVVTFNSNGAGHRNLLIQNNTIYNCGYAAVASGASTISRVSNVRFQYNTIGTDSISFYNNRIGIYLTYSDSISLEKNTVKNVMVTAASTVSTGINIGAYCTNSIINGNRISGIYSTGTNGGANGISWPAPTGIDNIRISNNIIYNIVTAQNSATVNGTNFPAGIRLNGGTNIKLYFNTVHLSGTLTAGPAWGISAALVLTQPSIMTGLDIRNNIFSNNMQGPLPTSKHYVLGIYPAFSGTYLFDYNNFVTNSPQGIFLSHNNIELNTLAAIKTTTSANINSVSINPQFINDSNLTIGYGALTGLGTPIADVTTDIEDSLRSTPPTPGAYERKTDLAGPAITYTLLTKNSGLVNRILTDFATITDYSGIDTTTAKPRIYFRKSTDANVFGNYPADNVSSFNGWKYVEATNTVSPFSFTIDYSLFPSVSLWDTIVYFVAAQDMSAKVSATPPIGFSAISINSVTNAPQIPNRYVIYDTPLSGTYLVGSANSYPHFNTLTAAVNALQIRGLGGAVVLKLTDSLYTSPTETFPITISSLEGSSSINTLTIKPDSAEKVAIIGASATGLINLAGPENVIIDGSNNGSTSQDLFIQNMNTAGAGILLQGTAANQGAENCIIQNTLVKGASNTTSYGISLSGTSPGSLNGIGHKNILLQNNTIYNTRDAISVSGSSSTLMLKGISIVGNTIGSDTTSFSVGRTGIYIANTDSVLIRKNTIKNLKSILAANMTGITITNNTTNSAIAANVIKGIYATGTSGYSAYGISIEVAADNITLYNNVISDIRGTYASITIPGSYGIRIVGNSTISNIKLYFNTVSLYGATTISSLNSSAALGLTEAFNVGLDIRNNIFSNSMTSSVPASKHFAAYSFSTFPSSIFDYNDFSANSAQGVLMRTSNGTTTTNALTIEDVRTLTNANANSVNINPKFVNDSLLIPNLGTVEGKGIAMPEVTVDIKDSLRSAIPTPGAYEKTIDALSPAIIHSVLPKTTALTNRTFSVAITDNSGVDTSERPRVYYRKSSDANVFGTYPADNNASFNGWKYVEASNTTSPFNFTIDYSLLQGGAVSIWETIVYFVVAQDIYSPRNIASNPDSSGLIATSVSAVTRAPNTQHQYTIYDMPLAGSYNVGYSNTYPNFSSITAATDAATLRGVSAPVTFQLTDSIYSIAPVIINEIPGSSAANTLTIKPAPGKSVTIKSVYGYSGPTLIALNGTDNIIIDGSNNGTTSQNLFIQNDNYQVAIMFQGNATNQGAQNSVLKNTIIKGSSYYAPYGVFIGGSNASLASNGIGHNNLLVQNNTIYNCNYPVVLSGTSSTAKVKLVTLRGNTIGCDTTDYMNTLYGIYLTHTDSVTLEHNSIKNQVVTTSANTTAIHIGDNTSNCKINANTINRISSINSYNTSACGINVASAIGTNNIIISNNVISDIVSYAQLSSLTGAAVSGIRVAGGTNVRLYFNTIHLLPSSSFITDVRSSASLLITSTSLPGLDIRNNIFSNNLIGDNSSKQYALISPTTLAASLFDNNDFITNSTQGVLMRGYSGTTPTDYITLAQLKSATNANANSVSINPFFISNTNLTPNLGTIEGLGVTIAGITLDILDSTRSSTPTLGAYEKGIDGLSPVITYTPLTQATQLTNRTLTGFATITDYSGINTTTAKPRLYFKKSSDTAVFGNYPTNNNTAFNGWKYVEATNTSSPFSFTIDYSLLTNGGIAIWDTVQYFVVATDNASTPHFSANPSVGFVASSINTITSAPTIVNQYIIVDNPLAGNYLVGANQVYPNFTSIKNAVSALNLSGISAPVALLLTDSLYSTTKEVFPITINEIVGSSPLNTITIKPASGKKVAIIGESFTGIINLNGADNIIVDGSNDGTTTHDLFIQNTNFSQSAVFMFQGNQDSLGSRNCTLKNAILKGLRSNTIGVLIGGQAANLYGGGPHYNLTVKNNIIYSCWNAVVIMGTQNSRARKVLLSDNTIGSDSTDMNISGMGLFISNADSLTVSNNIIKKIRGGSSNNIGIHISGNTTNGVFSKNVITGILGSPYSSGASYDDDAYYHTCGIKISEAGNDNIEFRNNVITDVRNEEYGSGIGYKLRVHGIRIQQGNNIRLYFNSVHLTGQLVRGSCASLYIDPALATNLDIRNNIFSNSLNRSYSEEGISFALCMNGAGLAPNAIFDYNNFTVGGNYGVLMTVKNGLTLSNISSLAGLKNATNANANSVNINPRFASGTNLVLGKGTLASLGVSIPHITDDIVDSLRSNPPTIGAYEKGADITGPEISYVPLDNAKTLSNRILTDFADITDYSAVNTTTAKPRLYYRKSTNAAVFGTYPANNNASFNGWKYVEALNTASPFSFTIDYSKLPSGIVSELDTIVYFIVAQDSLNNISSNPGIDFDAARIDSILTAPTNLNSYMIEYIPLAGTYLVGATQTAPNYTTITAAVNALHLRGISAPVVFQLTSATYTTPAETFPIVINEIVGASIYDSNTITFKPAPGNNVSITGTVANNGLFTFNGTDRIIFDGSNNGTSSQNIYLRNLNSTGYGVWFQGDYYNQGAQNSVFKNIKIRGASNSSSYGIIVGGPNTVYSSGGSMLGGIGLGGYGHDSLLIQNNTVYNCVDGLVISGDGNGYVRGVQIIGNTFGTDTTTLPITRNGIYMQFCDGVTIAKNTIKNVKTTSTYLNATGINVKDYTFGLVINANTIKGIYATNVSGTGAYGIDLDAPGINGGLISNNVINDIMTTNFSSSPTSPKNPYGIRIANASSLKIYFNTIHLFGQPTVGNNQSSSAAILLLNTYDLDIRNNIFSNSMTGKIAGSKHYALSMAYLPYFVAFDNNDFIANSPHGVLMADTSTSTGINTLAGLQAATFANTSSVSINPQFVSNTDLRIGANTLQGLGTPIMDTLMFWASPTVYFTKDILDSTRRVPPSIGAYEGPQSTTPVKLISFNAQLNAENVDLWWATASETNNKGFDIERSVDGKVFEKISFVKGAGTSNNKVRYTLTDINPFVSQNVLYYRLKQLDFDGQYAYSAIVRVNKKQDYANGISVFPNPYSSTFAVSFTTTTTGSATIELMNLQGTVINTQHSAVATGINTIEMAEANGADPGVYIVRLTINNEVHFVKLVKK